MKYRRRLARTVAEESFNGARRRISGVRDRDAPGEQAIAFAGTEIAKAGNAVLRDFELRLCVPC